MATKLKGVHWMLATPFNEDETVDEASIPNLVGKARESGCEGVVALGVMGEAHRLTDAEGRGVAEAVISAADGLPVTLGTSGPSTMVAIARTREAKEMGAAAVMVAPPPMPKTNLEAVYAHYYRLAEAVDIDLVVQDYPKTTGVHMPPGVFHAAGRQHTVGALLQDRGATHTAEDSSNKGSSRRQGWQYSGGWAGCSWSTNWRRGRRGR